MDAEMDAVMFADLTLTRIVAANLEGDDLADRILQAMDEGTARLVLAVAITRLTAAAAAVAATRPRTRRTARERAYGAA